MQKPKIPECPYHAGPSVGNSSAFIGRRDVLQAVKNVIDDPMSNIILLFGQRRIGKTSVLKELEAKLPQEECLPIFFDLESKDPSRDKDASLRLQQIIKELGVSICKKLSLDKDCSNYRKNKKIKLEDLLANWPSFSEKKLVLLFDEFEAVAGTGAEEETAGSAFFSFWRKKLVDQVDTRFVNFVFTIGRKVEDLNKQASSSFKSARSQKVSLLDRDDTIKLIKLSDSAENKTLQWSEESIEKVWSKTTGHPYLTQALCLAIWEKIIDENGSHSDSLPTVTPKDVGIAALERVLDISQAAFKWLWDGLPPAEKMVISLLATCDTPTITETDLHRRLKGSGTRLIQQEDVQRAVSILEEWDLIEQITDQDFRFRVELFRLWVVRHKSPNKVQQELDKVNVPAHRRYESARAIFLEGQLEQAADKLNEVLVLQPDHVEANELLGRTLWKQGKMDEARKVLESLYLLVPSKAEHLLIGTLEHLAKDTQDEDKQLTYHQRILEIAPECDNAKKQCAKIWRRRGQSAEQTGDLNKALEFYEKAELPEQVTRVQRKIYEKQGDEFYQIGDLERALEAYKKAGRGFTKKIAQIEQEISQTREYEKQGDEFYQIGDLEGALESYEKAGRGFVKKVAQIKQEISQAKVYEKQGDEFYQIGDLERALEAYKKAGRGFTKKIAQIEQEISQTREVESSIIELKRQFPQVEVIFLYHLGRNLLYSTETSKVTKEKLLKSLFSGEILQNLKATIDHFGCGTLKNALFPFTDSSILGIYFVDAPLIIGVIVVDSPIGTISKIVKGLEKNLPQGLLNSK